MKCRHSFIYGTQRGNHGGTPAQDCTRSQKFHSNSQRKSWASYAREWSSARRHSLSFSHTHTLLNPLCESSPLSHHYHFQSFYPYTWDSGSSPSSHAHHMDVHFPFSQFLMHWHCGHLLLYVSVPSAVLYSPFCLTRLWFNLFTNLHLLDISFCVLFLVFLLPFTEDFYHILDCAWMFHCWCRTSEEVVKGPRW